MVKKDRKAVLFPQDELKPGTVRAVQVGARKLVVARASNGSFSVMRDRCPHLGAPLSAGRLQPMVQAEDVGGQHMSDVEVLVCPWHRFEYNLQTGACEADPQNHRVKTYEVEVEEGMVVVHL